MNTCKLSAVSQTGNMNKISKFLLCMIFILLLVCTVAVQDNKMTVHAFSPQVIQQGAVGEDVIELQARLKYIGFYHGKVDGVFGWSTYWALRNFQYEFGMEIDGIAGTKVKEKLVKATKYDAAETKKEMYKTPNNQGAANNNAGKQEQGNKETTAVNVPQGFSQNDIKLLANAVHGEARESHM